MQKKDLMDKMMIRLLIITFLLISCAAVEEPHKERWIVASQYLPKEQLKGLNEFKRRLIPKYASNGVEFEYDLWFNTNEINTIRRFLYTDFLGKGIYTRVNSVKINTAKVQKCNNIWIGFAYT